MCFLGALVVQRRLSRPSKSGRVFVRYPRLCLISVMIARTRLALMRSHISRFRLYKHKPSPSVVHILGSVGELSILLLWMSLAEAIMPAAPTLCVTMLASVRILRRINTQYVAMHV